MVGVYSNVLHLHVHICILRYCVVGNGLFLVVMGIKNTKKTTLMTGLFLKKYVYSIPHPHTDNSCTLPNRLRGKKLQKAGANSNICNAASLF